MEVHFRIVTGAIELFLRSGIKGVTMNDIASHLGISKRTIYENFADKDALISACLTYIFTKRDDFYRDLINNAENVVDVFVGFVESGARFHDDRVLTMINEIKRLYPVIFEKIVLENRKDGHATTIILIERGMREGYILMDTNVELATDLFQGQMSVVGNSEVLNSGKYSFIDIFRTMVITFFRGIATLEGAAEMDKKLKIVVRD